MFLPDHALKEYIFNFSQPAERLECLARVRHAREGF
jgi:hypothetical protein